MEKPPKGFCGWTARPALLPRGACGGSRRSSAAGPLGAFRRKAGGVFTLQGPPLASHPEGNELPIESYNCDSLDSLCGSWSCWIQFSGPRSHLVSPIPIDFPGRINPQVDSSCCNPQPRGLGQRIPQIDHPSSGPGYRRPPLFHPSPHGGSVGGSRGGLGEGLGPIGD